MERKFAETASLMCIESTIDNKNNFVNNYLSCTYVN